MILSTPPIVNSLPPFDRKKTQHNQTSRGTSKYIGGGGVEYLREGIDIVICEGLGFGLGLGAHRVPMIGAL